MTDAGTARELPRKTRDELALQSLLSMGRTAPNPSVACVVIAENDRRERLLFSGGTERAGERHAEIVALDALDRARKNDPSLRPSRLYVTLEPCSTRGRTPPCSDRILRYPELRNVTVYRRDIAQSKNSLEILQSAGKRIRLPTPREDFDPGVFVDGFLHRIGGGGPRLHLKVALTDENVMGRSDSRLLISGPQALGFGMILRSRCDAVLVGPGTIAQDRPGLDLRSVSGWTTPEEIRVFQKDYFSESLLANSTAIARRIEEDALSYQPERIFLLGREFPGWTAFREKQNSLEKRTGKPARFLCPASRLRFWRDKLGDKPGDIREVPESEDPRFAARLRETLGEMGLNEVLVEGGARLFSRLQEALTPLDRIYALISRKTFPKTEEEIRLLAPEFLQRGPDLIATTLGEDVLFIKQAQKT